MLEEVGPRLKMAGTYSLPCVPRTAYACAREGKTIAKGFVFADHLFCNEHKVEMERKRKEKKKPKTKQQKMKLKEKCKGGRGRNKGIRTCCWRDVSLQQGPPITTRRQKQ